MWTSLQFIQNVSEHFRHQVIALLLQSFKKYTQTQTLKPKLLWNTIQTHNKIYPKQANSLGCSQPHEANGKCKVHPCHAKLHRSKLELYSSFWSHFTCSYSFCLNKCDNRLVKYEQSQNATTVIHINDFTKRSQQLQTITKI